MPAVMIRKCAMVTALREAFPEDLQGMYDALKDGIKAEIKDISAKAANGTAAGGAEEVDIKFGYCTEFILQLQHIAPCKTISEVQYV